MKLAKNYYFITIFVLSIAGRLIPHPANMTPMISLALIAAAYCSRLIGLLTIAIAVLISDLLLAVIMGYPAFTLVSLFTYSGFITITFLGSLRTSNSKKSLLISTVFATCGFWLWTNLGVWLTTSMYPMNSLGLAACYTAALPFLRNSLIGSLVWMVILAIFLKPRTANKNSFIPQFSPVQSSNT